MLYLETSKGFVPWTGQKIDGMSHPLDIEDKWTKEELAELRLYRPETPPIPEGKRVVDRRVARENGKVVFVLSVEDEPMPAAPPRDLAAEIDDLKSRVAALEAGKPRA